MPPSSLFKPPSAPSPFNPPSSFLRLEAPLKPPGKPRAYRRSGFVTLSLAFLCSSHLLKNSRKLPQTCPPCASQLCCETLQCRLHLKPSNNLSYVFCCVGKRLDTTQPSDFANRQCKCRCFRSGRSGNSRHDSWKLSRSWWMHGLWSSAKCMPRFSRMSRISRLQRACLGTAYSGQGCGQGMPCVSGQGQNLSQGLGQVELERQGLTGCQGPNIGGVTPRMNECRKS